MARVHLFSSYTQPYNYKRSPEDIDTEEPSLLPATEEEEGDVIANTTIEEQPRQQNDKISASKTTISYNIASTAAAAAASNQIITAPSSLTEQQQEQQEHEILAHQLSSNSAALTAALLQSAHENSDVVGAVAAALSVKPDSFHINQQGQVESNDISMNASEKEDVMDQAAAATALQLLGLSAIQPAKKSTQQKDAATQQDKNALLIANYTGLASNLEDIDLNSEEMMQDYKRGTWTREEDELLLAGIKRYGYGRWKEIAVSIPSRKGKQLKQRWDNTLAAKYVDQEWLRNKVRSDQELQQQASSSSATVTNEVNKNEDKALTFLEATDWNDIALKITEKAREGDQHAIEALLSQALMGAVAGTQTPITNTAPTSTTVSPHPSPSIITPTIVQHDSDASTPTVPATVTVTPPLPPATTTNDNDALTLNFTRSPINPNSPPSINFADAAALAIYAQQLSQTNSNTNSNTTSPQLAALVNHPYFLTPFTTSSSNTTTDDTTATALSAAAVASAVAQQQHQTENESSSSSSPNVSTATTAAAALAVAGQKRRRSDPALADTQSAAMTIYASATPITTTVNNTTQTVYPCLFPNCGKTFARLYNLKSHSRTHTDDRPFVCHACTAAFSRNHDLKRHSKIHGGDKPYRCEGCKKSFSRLDALKRHKSNQRNKQGCSEEA